MDFFKPSEEVKVRPVSSRKQLTNETQEEVRNDDKGNLLLIENLKLALDFGNKQEIQIALEKLAQNIDEHPGNTSAFLASLKYETNFSQMLIRLAEVSSTQPSSVGAQLVTDLAVDIAQTELVANRRHAGLAALAKVIEPGTNLIQTVAKISREDGEQEVRSSALATVAAWTQQNSK
ncbi:MAG: hypothetical protein ACR2H1_13265 [Limisphaerales bacterium]